MSRHAIHYDNMHSFQPLHLNFVLFVDVEKIPREMAKNEVANNSRCYVPNLGTGHYLCGGGGGRRRGRNHGVAQAYFILEKRGGPKEIFTMVGGGSLCVL